MGIPGSQRLTGWFGGLGRRRRMLLGGAVLVVVALLVVAGARYVASTVGTGSRAVPAQDRPGPVLLVPGYGGGADALSSLAGRIRALGRDATVVRLPGNATGDLGQQADVLDRYVQDALRGGAPSVDLIGHSAGGIVARLWVQQHDGARKARRVVTLGSPHHGASIAAAGSAVLPDACPTACRQLAPGSRLLATLDNPVPRPPSWLSVWTVQDETVTPPDSARLEGAVNVAVQSICPGVRVSHGDLPSNPVVARMVLDAIGAGPLTAPTASVCQPR